MDPPEQQGHGDSESEACPLPQPQPQPQPQPAVDTGTDTIGSNPNSRKFKPGQYVRLTSKSNALARVQCSVDGGPEDCDGFLLEFFEADDSKASATADAMPVAALNGDDSVSLVCSFCFEPSVDFKYCSRCKVAVYCNVECQTGDWAAGHGQHECVTLSAYRRLSKLPMYLATAAGDLELLPVLIENEVGNNGFDVNQVICKGIPMTLLHVAAAWGQHKIILFLIGQGADKSIDMAGISGMTPLHLAASNGHLGAVECLVTHNANMNQIDDDGNTPIILATSMGHSDITHFLAKRLFEGPKVKSLKQKLQSFALVPRVLPHRTPKSAGSTKSSDTRTTCSDSILAPANDDDDAECNIGVLMAMLNKTLVLLDDSGSNALVPLSASIADISKNIGCSRFENNSRRTPKAAFLSRKRELAEAGIMDALMNALSNPIVKSVGMATLAILTCVKDLLVECPAAQVALAGTGKSAALVAILNEHMTDSQICQEMSNLLSEFAVNPIIRKHLIEDGTFSALGAVLLAHPADDTVCFTVISAISMLLHVKGPPDDSHQRIPMQAALSASVCPQSLPAVMQRHITEAHFVVPCLEIIGHFDSAGKVAAVAAGVGAAVLAVLKVNDKFSDICRLACIVLRSLAEDSQIVPVLVAEGAFPGLLVVAQAHPLNILVIQAVVDAMDTLISDGNTTPSPASGTSAAPAVTAAVAAAATNSEPLRNRDGVVVHKGGIGTSLNMNGGDTGLPPTQVYYCGRQLNQCRCGVCDGHCGPYDGCPCEACKALLSPEQLRQSLPSSIAVDPVNSGHGRSNNTSIAIGNQLASLSNNKNNYNENDAFMVLTTMLRRYASDSDDWGLAMTSQLLSVLWRITNDGNPAAVLSRLGEAGAIAVLVSLLEKCHSSLLAAAGGKTTSNEAEASNAIAITITVCEKACAVLWNLSAHLANQPHLITATAMVADVLVKTLVAVVVMPELPVISEKISTAGVKKKGKNKPSSGTVPITMPTSGVLSMQPSPLHVLQASPSLATVCEKVCGAIFAVGRTVPTNRTQLVSTGSGLALVAALSTYRDHAGVTEAACAAVYSLSAPQDTTLFAVSNEMATAAVGDLSSVRNTPGLCEALAEALRRHSVAPAVCMQVCRALVAVAAGDICGGTMNSNNLEAQMVTAEIGSALVDAMSRHGSNSVMCRQIAAAITAVAAVGPSSRAALIRANVCEAIARAMVAHMQNFDTMLQISRAISNVVTPSNGRELYTKFGQMGITGLNTMMVLYAKSSTEIHQRAEQARKLMM